VTDLAPELPDNMPPEVRDFFSCRADKLVWPAGDTAWLGGGTSADISFTSGADPGVVNINISAAHGLFSFTIPLSVDDAGALVVDRSAIPELPGGAGAAGLDAAVNRINQWFRQNGKRLKPLELQDGALVLEKVPAATSAEASEPVQPAQIEEPVSGASNRGCALLALLLVALLGAGLLGVTRPIRR
jgi:hypothetical protein